MNCTKPIEILAPAGNFDSLVAAVRCGANAVYLGSKSLNARRGASNFDDEELARAVEYCHVRGVKVHQTLNIVMFEEEVSEAVSAIETASRLGVDALLVQDMGIARLARELAPQLPLHASTQMTIHNLAGAREAERLGFRRVVLAREMSRKEIQNIIENTGLEVEVFVHGALCMSVSGQCYLSSMIGERSGNRGLCAQPCRLPFQARGGAEYGLSLRDLSLVDRVEELREMGVASLKIEGRMKRPEYVAAAVTALKNAAEGVYVDFDGLRSIYSRSGFTRGYFEGQRDASMFGTREKEDVTAAQGVLPGLARLYDREQPLVPVDFVLTAQAGEPMLLVVSDRDGNRAEVTGEQPQIAQNRPTDAERAGQSLAKTGGTPFLAQKILCQIGEGLMLPAAALNALRRDGLEALASLRGRPRSFPYTPPAPRERGERVGQRGTVPSFRVRLTGAQLTNYIAESCDSFILPLGDIPGILARGLVQPGQIIAEIPRILFTGEERVAAQLAALAEQGVSRAWAGNLGALGLAREAGMAAVGGYSLNIVNSEALAHYREMGLAETELSFELSLGRIRRLEPALPVGILAYGYLPLMALRNCPVKAAMGCEKCSRQETMVDRKKARFMVSCRDMTFSELHNSVPLYLEDRLEELRGLDFLTLYFTRESREECDQVARAYLEGTAPPVPREGKTRGLYYRNVL